MSVLTFGPRRSHPGRRRAHRLDAHFEEASHLIREHLDSELVFRAAGEAVVKAMGRGQTSIWLTTGTHLRACEARSWR